MNKQDKETKTHPCWWCGKLMTVPINFKPHLGAAVCDDPNCLRELEQHYN